MDIRLGQSASGPATAAGAVLTLALLGGCANSGGNAGPTVTPIGPQDSWAVPANQSTGGNPPPVALADGGAPASGTEEYVALTNRDGQCLDTQDVQPDSISAALAAVCGAVAADSDAHWATAVALLKSLPSPPAADCAGAKLHAMLDVIVRTHEESPATPIPLKLRTSTPCPLSLTGVTVVDRKGLPVAGLDRPWGSPKGGTRVRLDGRLGDVTALLINGADATKLLESPSADGVWFFTSPPANGQQQLRIRVRTTENLPGEALFFYAPGKTLSPSPTPTGSTATPKPSTNPSSGTSIKNPLDGSLPTLIQGQK